MTKKGVNLNETAIRKLKELNNVGNGIQPNTEAGSSTEKTELDKSDETILKSEADETTQLSENQEAGTTSASTEHVDNLTEEQLKKAKDLLNGKPFDFEFNGFKLRAEINKDGVYTDEVFDFLRNEIMKPEWRYMNIKALDLPNKIIFYQGNKTNQYLVLNPVFDTNMKLIHYNYHILHSYGRKLLATHPAFKPIFFS